MHTYNQCTHTTHDHPCPEDHMDNGFITYDIGFLLKRWERGKGGGAKTSGIIDNKGRNIGTQG